jgi:hypothetical protein
MNSECAPDFEPAEPPPLPTLLSKFQTAPPQDITTAMASPLPSAPLLRATSRHRRFTMSLQVMDYLSSGDEADVSIQSESPPPSPRPTSAEMPNKHRNRKTSGPHEGRQPKPKPKPELWTCDVCGCSIHEGLVPKHVVGVKHVKKTAERERLRSEGLLVAGGSGNESEFPAAADKVKTSPPKKDDDDEADSVKSVPGTSSTDPASPDKVWSRPLNSTETVANEL